MRSQIFLSSLLLSAVSVGPAMCFVENVTETDQGVHPSSTSTEQADILGDLRVKEPSSSHSLEVTPAAVQLDMTLPPGFSGSSPQSSAPSGSVLPPSPTYPSGSVLPPNFAPSAPPSQQFGTKNCDCRDQVIRVQQPQIVWKLKEITLCVEVYEPVEESVPFCDAKCVQDGVCESVVGTQTVRKMVKRLRRLHLQVPTPEVTYVPLDVRLKCGVRISECPPSGIIPPPIVTPFPQATAGYIE